MTTTADGRPGRRFTDDDMLAAIARAEKAEAAHDRTRGRLTNTQVDLAIVTKDRDELAQRLNPVELASKFWSHLYTCDQATDPCYQHEKWPTETWDEFAQRRAEHLAAVMLDDTPSKELSC